MKWIIYCIRILSSNKIINFVEWVEIETCVVNKIFNWEKMDFLANAFPSSFVVKKKKKGKERFLLVFFYIFDLHIYLLSFIQIIISILFLRTIKCNYMSLNVVMELSIWKGNEHLFLCSALNPVLLWNCSSNMATQTLKHKIIFLSPVSLSLWRGRSSSYRNQSIN